MAYLTLFSIPKGFSEPHTTLIQHNALASWCHLGADVEILLMGDDPGVAEAAAEYGALHVPGIRVNDYGTPLLDSAFREAASRGSGDVLCYLNADIVLLSDFVPALRRLSSAGRYLAIGQRWDCDVEAKLDFEADGSSLGRWAHQTGKLDAGRGSDYFAYPREVDFGLPPFAVGRPGWDNWMMGRALELGLPLIDLTPSVTVIHQNHGYRHVSKSTGSAWEGPEAESNRRLAGSIDRYIHSPANCTHVLTPTRLRRALSIRHSRARIEAFAALHPAAKPLRSLIELVRRRT